MSLGLGLCCGRDGTGRNELCCGLVRSLVCPAGAEQLLTAMVGWPRELQVLSWELPWVAACTAAALPSVVLVLAN